MHKDTFCGIKEAEWTKWATFLVGALACMILQLLVGF